MRSIYLIIVILSCFTFNNSAQIQPESVEWDTPQISSKNMLWSSEAGPLIIVKIDSVEYRLDSLTMTGIDSEWIQSISVFRDGTATEMYGSNGKHGVIIISLKEGHFEDFINGRKPKTPLRIKKVNEGLD